MAPKTGPLKLDIRQPVLIIIGALCSACSVTCVIPKCKQCNRSSCPDWAHTHASQITKRVIKRQTGCRILARRHVACIERIAMYAMRPEFTVRHRTQAGSARRMYLSDHS